MQGQFSTSSLSDALVILGAAGVVIPAFARIRISPIIGFILIGMLVGPAGLGALTPKHPWLHYVTISNPHAIDPFAELGIVLLLFSVGLELSFRRLWAMRRQVFGVGAAELLTAAILVGSGLYLTGQSIGASVGLGLALALSSTAIVIPLVGTQSAVGRSAFAMLLFEDLALVPIVFLLGALAPHGSESDAGALLRTIGIGAATTLGMLFLGRLLLPRLFEQAARAKNPELFLSACLIVVIASSLVTSAVGFSAVLGALIAGIVIAETDYRSEVEIITGPFRGLGLGIFLITVGMSVDVRAIANQWQAILAAVAGVLLVKALVTSLLLRLSGARSAVAAETGVLMASPSETTLIVLASAGAARLISPETAAFWQTVTAIGLTVTPLLAKLGRLAGSRFAGQALEQQIDRLDGPDRGQVIILGFGRVGRMVADMLATHAKGCIAIDSDVDVVQAARAEGYEVLFGDVARPELVEGLRKLEPSAFILTMDNPVLAKRLSVALRRAFPDLPLIARARDASHAAELYRAGVTDAVPETLEASLQLSEAALVDLGVAMGPVIASIHEKRDSLRAQIKSEAGLDEKPRLGGRRTVGAVDALRDT